MSSQKENPASSSSDPALAPEQVSMYSTYIQEEQEESDAMPCEKRLIDLARPLKNNPITPDPYTPPPSMMKF